MNKKRFDYLDAAKGIGILLTVLGHVGFDGDRMLFFIFSFHMPLFFIVSGMLSATGPKRAFKETLKRKALSLIVPYAIFSVLGIVIYFVMNGLNFFSKDGLTMLRSMAFESVTLKGLFVLWFFPVMFFAGLLLEGVAKKLNGYVNLTLCVIAVIVLTLFGRKAELFLQGNYDTAWKCALINLGLVAVRTVIALVFMIAGFYFGRFVSQKGIVEKVSGTAYKKAFSVIGGLVLWGILFFTSWENGSVDFASIHFSNGVVYFFNAFLGTAGCLMISVGLTGLKPLLWAGRNSVGIMVSHLNFYFMYFAELTAYKVSQIVFGVTDKNSFTDLNRLVCIATAFLVATGLSVAFTFVTVRYLPWIYGRKRAN